MVISNDLFKKCGNVISTIQLVSNDYETVQYITFSEKFSTPFFQDNGKIYTTKEYKGYFFPVDENGKIYDGYSVDGQKVYIVNPKTKNLAYAYWYTSKVTLKKSDETFSVIKY